MYNNFEILKAIPYNAMRLDFWKNKNINGFEQDKEENLNFLHTKKEENYCIGFFPVGYVSRPRRTMIQISHYNFLGSLGKISKRFCLKINE